MIYEDLKHQLINYLKRISSSPLAQGMDYIYIRDLRFIQVDHEMFKNSTGVKPPTVGTRILVPIRSSTYDISNDFLKVHSPQSLLKFTVNPSPRPEYMGVEITDLSRYTETLPLLVKGEGGSIKGMVYYVNFEISPIHPVKSLLYIYFNEEGSIEIAELLVSLPAFSGPASRLHLLLTLLQSKVNLEQDFLCL